MNWIKIAAQFDKPPEDWSPFIEVLRQHGCDSTLIEDNPPSIVACIQDVPGADHLVGLIEYKLSLLGAAGFFVMPVADQDWVAEYRKHFHSRRIGKNFVITPTWEKYATGPNDIVIVLDPGQAFGTGDHQTTRMCLALLEDLDLKDKRVVDLGCGSGILSIAAKKLGAAEVIGIDIEPISVEVAKENARENDVQAQFLVADSIAAGGDGPWDAVLSNIVSATLIVMAPDIASRLQPGSVWLVSGIIEQNFADVRAAAERCGLKLDKTVQEDQWMAAIFRR